MAIWNALLEAIEQAIRFFQQGFEPVFGVFAWGWAIIALTFAVRLLLLPLAIKQTRSMRAMQELQPELKRIQKKYKADRSLMRTDPDKYRERRRKQQEETMKLYQEKGVNPAASCLPLILQMPIFFALFTVLRDAERLTDMARAPWYGITQLSALPNEGLAAAGIGTYILIIGMVASTFWSQKQMMSRQVATGPQASQQRILLYVMPAMLAFFSFALPIGVLLYWVATNVWTIVQQWVIFRSVDAAASGAGGGAGGNPSAGDGEVGGDGRKRAARRREDAERARRERARRQDDPRRPDDDA